MGRLPQRTRVERWRYTSVAAAREEAGLSTVDNYIRQRQKTAARYIAMQSLLELCEGSERDPGE